MHNKLVISTLAFSLLTAAATTAFCAEELKTPNKISGNALAISAVVGEQAISSFDVNNRIKFILSTTKISNTPDIIAHIKPQVIRTLIDESLQIQEAEKNGIKVTDEEVEKAIAGIESSRGMPAGEIERMLASGNVPIKTFKDQIHAQIAWSKLLGAKIRNKIKISDDEVTLAKKNDDIIKKPSSPKTDSVKIKEVEIAVINLVIDKPQREEEIKKLSEKLYNELIRGASFEDVANQFSASSDGKPFWINPSQLDANVAKILRVTGEGSITKPIRTHDGFSIIKLLHIRADKVAVKKEPEKQEESTSEAEKQNAENLAREYLFKQKFDLEAQKYMRNLRRQTFIDIR